MGAGGGEIGEVGTGQQEDEQRQRAEDKDIKTAAVGIQLVFGIGMQMDVGQRLEAAFTCRHQGNLRHDEQSVQNDQKKEDDQFKHGMECWVVNGVYRLAAGTLC